MIHEFEIKADTLKQAFHQCNEHCNQLDSFPLVGLMYEIESIMGVKNDIRNQKKTKLESPSKFM
jgi:hypothetical protein